MDGLAIKTVLPVMSFMSNHLFALVLSVVLISISACKHKAVDPQINSFEKSFGDISEDLGNDIILSDRSLFLLGSTSTTSGTRIFLIKTDIDGNEIWNRKLGVGSTASGSSMILEDNGNLTICGTSNDRSTVFHTGNDGHTIWQSTGDSTNSQGNAILKIYDGYLVCGTVENEDRDLLISKIDLAGNQQWSRTFGGPMNEGGSGLAPLLNGNYLLYGYTESFGAGNRDHWLLEINSHGDSLNSLTIGGSDYEESQEIVSTPDNGFLICGHSASVEPNHSLHVVKVNQSLEIEWERHLGYPDSHEGGEGITIDELGNIYAIGRSSSSSTNGEDVFLSKLSSDGTLASDTLIGGNFTDRGNAVTVNASHIFIVGSTNSIGAGDNDVYLVKMPR